MTRKPSTPTEFGLITKDLQALVRVGTNFQPPFMLWPEYRVEPKRNGQGFLADLSFSNYNPDTGLHYMQFEISMATRASVRRVISDRRWSHGRGRDPQAALENLVLNFGEMARDCDLMVKAIDRGDSSGRSTRTYILRWNGKSWDLADSIPLSAYR